MMQYESFREMSDEDVKSVVVYLRTLPPLQGENAPIAPKGQNTVMPWLPFSGMTTDDLGMIYDYLKTIPPIENRVVTFPDAPKPAG